MKKVLIAASTCLSVFAGVAYAGSMDETVIEPMVVTHNTPDWGGFYISALAGSSSGLYTNGVSALDEIGVDIDMSGLIYGAKAGYNFQNGAFVYGIEADISNGPTGLTPQGNFGPDWSCGSGDCYANIDIAASIRGRVGFVTPQNLMFYGTAGLGFAQVTGGIAGSSQEGGGSATGLVYGGGVETMFGQNSSIGAEYLMYDISPIPFGDNGFGDVFDAVGGFSVIRAFYTYRF